LQFYHHTSLTAPALPAALAWYSDDLIAGFPGMLVSTVCKSVVEVHEVAIRREVAEVTKSLKGGGLLIRPELFAQTDFCLFCYRYNFPRCAESSHLQSIVQQMFSKNSAARRQAARRHGKPLSL
jgi:hypothetical protein